MSYALIRFTRGSQVRKDVANLHILTTGKSSEYVIEYVQRAVKELGPCGDIGHVAVHTIRMLAENPAMHDVVLISPEQTDQKIYGHYYEVYQENGTAPITVSLHVLGRDDYQFRNVPLDEVRMALCA